MSMTYRSDWIRSGVAAAVIVAFGTALTVSAASVEEGAQLLQEKKYAEAENVLRAAVGESPDSADANYYLGVALVEQEKYGEAEGVLQKAVEQKPEARVSLAKAYMMQDKLDDALRELAAAEPALPDNSDLYLNRGMILLKQEKYADASTQLNRAVELNPMSAYAHYYLGMASSRLRRTDLMIKHFQLFLELAPDAPEAARVRSLLRSL
jgi:tetratricopeptide (TPR) repeat protein